MPERRKITISRFKVRAAIAAASLLLLIPLGRASAASLTGSMSVATNGTYNLTTVGSSDWKAWAVGTGSYNDSHIDNKSSGGSQIGTYYTVGSGGAYGTWNGGISLNWSDGSPTASYSNESGFEFQNANYNTAPNAGFAFTVPADTNSRTLNVLFGGNTCSATIVAALSDGSATAYTNTQNLGTTTIANLYTFSYTAGSAGKYLTITMTKTGNNGSTTNGSVNLWAAWLTGGGGGGGGSLSGTTTSASFAYNLTSVGTSDWEAWAVGTGSGNSANTYRLSGANQISGFTKINTTNAYFDTWSDSRLNLNWTNGTPGNTSGDGGFVFQNASYSTAPNGGFTFSAPADTTTRTLYVLSGGNTCSTTLVASLSDGSASAYTYSQNIGTTTVLNLTTVTYHAATAGQHLVITFVKSGNNGSTTNGSANLTAAWLTGGSGGGPTVINDDDPSIVYSQGNSSGGYVNWYHITSSNDLFGDEWSSDFQAAGGPTFLGASIALSFNGTGLQWIGSKGSNYGIASYSVDGGSPSTINNYNASYLPNQYFTLASGLTSGSHVLNLQVSNSTTSSDYWQTIDGFSITGNPLPLSSGSVAGANSGLLSYSGAWTIGTGTNTQDISGDHAWSNTGGSTLSWGFTGSLIEVYGRPDLEDGYMDVYIDSVKVASNVDLRAGAIDNDLFNSMLLWSKKLTSGGSHTIKLNVDGTHDSGSTNNFVQIDELAAFP